MGELKGFLKVGRKESSYRPKEERVKDYQDVVVRRKREDDILQASRCMDCGTPFCHWACPLGNYIPEWNDYLYRKNYQRAYELLSATNVMPEVTGRLCPALCEYGCVLGVNDEAVTIRENELAIIEEAFARGLVNPNASKSKTRFKIAVIGSGPAGLSAAANLSRLGHKAVVFEKDSKVGGILRYGIPDFKLEKNIIDRRLNVWQEEGIEFVTNTKIDKNKFQELEKEFDAICLAVGSRQPRDLNIAGRELKGIYFAMDYLKQANCLVSGEKIEGEAISARGKKVLVIGGGDTGSDCVGTANRQQAAKIVQIELLPQPPEKRTQDFPWPFYPRLLKTTSSHKEGCERMWSVLTKKFVGEKGRLEGVECVKVKFAKDAQGKLKMEEIPQTEFFLPADLAVLAVGFLHPVHNGLIADLGLELDARGNIKTNANFQTSHPKTFACGDGRRGQSLIVWALAEGRAAASAIDKFLVRASS